MINDTDFFSGNIPKTIQTFLKKIQTFLKNDTDFFSGTIPKTIQTFKKNDTAL